jgi:hypothetical protein
MAIKASRGVLVGAAVAIIALLIGVSVIFGMTNQHKPAKDPPTSIVGPDTAQTTPDVATPPTQTAQNDPAAPTDPTAAPASVGPIDVTFQDEALKFKAELPAGPANDPVLTYLRDDAQRTLSRLKANSRAEFEREKRKGQSPPPWDVKIRWKYTARAGNLVSLAGEESEFNGGAHPNLHFDSHIAPAAGGKSIKVADMMQTDRSPSPAMIVGICEALKGAKLDRIHATTIFDDPIVCAGPNANAKTEAAVIALAPSNEPDKFGGVYVYYPPYSVGSNAEGAYRLTVQQGVFAQDLKPDYKVLFAGRAPELTSDR